MPMIPSGQRIKFDTIDPTRIENYKNAPKDKNTGAYNLEKILAQYAEAVDWIDEEEDDVSLPEAIKEISDRFDIKSFKEIKGDTPLTQEIIPLIDPKADLAFQYDENYFNNERGMAIGIAERLGVNLLPQGSKYMEELTVDDFITRMYSATAKLIYRMTQPKEVIKFTVNRHNVFGHQFNATCALISQEFVDEMKAILTNIIQDASKSGFPYSDIHKLNKQTEVITSIIQFTSKYFTDIAQQSFGRCIENPEFDGEFSLRIFYEKIDKLSNTQVTEHVETLNRDIFKISLRVCKDAILHMNLTDYQTKSKEFIEYYHIKSGMKIRPMKRKEWYEKITSTYYDIFSTFRDLDIRYTGDIFYAGSMSDCEAITNYIDPIVYNRKDKIISGWA